MHILYAYIYACDVSIAYINVNCGWYYVDNNCLTFKII